MIYRQDIKLQEAHGSQVPMTTLAGPARKSDEQHCIDAAIILWVVGNLGILPPDNLATGRHKTQLTYIHLQPPRVTSAQLGNYGRDTLIDDIASETAQAHNGNSCIMCIPR